jgi:RecJ-like exonuclease
MSIRILAHGDTDGVCSAALAKARFPKAEVWFTRPVTLLKDLEEAEEGSTVVILDIAVNETQREAIFKRMGELSSKGEILYIDHHPLPPRTLKKDIPASQVVHEIGASTSELTFRLFQPHLDPYLDRVALWGAIGDYCEETEFVLEALSRYNRHTIYMEAGLLSQALGEVPGDYHYKRDVVEFLAKNTPPMEIPEILERATKATKREWETWEYVKKHVIREGNLAMVLDLPSGSLSKAAFHCIGVTGADIGMATRRGEKEVDMSLRRKAGVKIDLNELLRGIVERIGGSGGGHEGAAGASVPVELFDTFLETLKKEISPILPRDASLRR